jgi:hypothetical protein
VLDEPVVCPKPPEDLMAEVFADHGDTPCDAAACSRPLSVAVRNPNEVPFFVSETQVLYAEGRGARMVEYDPPVFVPPDASIEMPGPSVVSVHHEDRVRVLYLDGWGNERFVVAPIESGEPLPLRRRQERGAEPCKATAPPPLEPLTLEASPTFSIHLHNPNAHRVRIVDLYVENPDRSTISPASEDAELHYVEPHASVRLPYHIDFDLAGRHVFRISVQDGWGRRHELHAPVDVSASGLRARDAAIGEERTATVPAGEGAPARR